MRKSFSTRGFDRTRHDNIVLKRKPWQIPVISRLLIPFSASLSKHFMHYASQRTAAVFTLLMLSAVGHSAYASARDTQYKAPNSTFEQARANSDTHNLTVSHQPPLIASAIALDLELILREHYVSQAGDPSSLPRDLQSLARYYARYPEAQSLILALKRHAWELKFAPNTFKTDISGTSLSVEKVTIYFDPKSGAKLRFYPRCEEKIRFCVASPADALLHEFLHVHNIFADLNRFIAKGGMSTHLYPIEHERDTIRKENALYKAMSERDKKPRPIRQDHVGKATLVGCVTCAK